MKFFSKSPLSDKLKEDMINKNIWSSKCPVSLDRLNLLKVSYVDFDGNAHHDGSIMVHDVVAEHVLKIFKKLYKHKFPIASVKLINDYNGNDEKSMQDNNTSAFNHRNIGASNLISLHSYGLAIDINPQQNPYLLNEYQENKSTINVFPPQGMSYINRLNVREGMVENKLGKVNVVDIFSKHGFKIWGGTWNYPIDWHHFQVSRQQAEIIAKLNYKEGIEFFNNLLAS